MRQYLAFFIAFMIVFGIPIILSAYIGRCKGRNWYTSGLLGILSWFGLYFASNMSEKPGATKSILFTSLRKDIHIQGTSIGFVVGIILIFMSIATAIGGVLLGIFNSLDMRGKIWISARSGQEIGTVYDSDVYLSIIGFIILFLSISSGMFMKGLSLIRRRK